MNEGFVQHGSIDNAGAGQTLDYAKYVGPVENSVSKLSAMLDRVRTAAKLADEARSHIGANLDRLLGAVPAAVTAGASNRKDGVPRVNAGAAGDLDDAISVLITSLEYLNTQAQRLASI